MKTYLKDRLNLFKQPAFSLFFMAAILGTLANGFVYISNTWLVVSLNHSLSAVLWSFLAFWLPKMLVSPFAGAVIDRVDRKLLAGFGIIIMGLYFGGFGIVLYFFPHLHIYWIYFIYFLLGAIGAFFLPGIMALMREIVIKKELLYANANIDLGYQLGNVCGIGLAGYIIHFLGFTGGYLISAGLFIVAGCCVFCISNKSRTKTKLKQIQSGVLKRFGHDFADGLRYVLSNQARLVLYVAQLFLMLILMTTPVLLAPFAKTILHANAIDFGHIEVMMTVGMIIGGIVLIYVAERIGFNRILLSSTLVLVVSIIGFSLVNSVAMGQLAYFFIGLSLGSWSILMSRAQALTHPDYQGRVESVFNMITSLVLIIFYLSMHALIDIMTIRHIYWVVGVFAIVPIALILIFPSYFDGD